MSEKHIGTMVRTTLIFLVLLVSGCGAIKVELPENLAQQIQKSGYVFPNYKANLLIEMNKDDAGLRYMAQVHDLKLQLNMGPSFKKNLTDVMTLMFTKVDYVESSIEEQSLSPIKTQDYILKNDGERWGRAKLTT